MHSLDMILSSIQEKYGSLAEPNFSFVHQARTRHLYRDVLSAISSSFSLAEDTDENDDVSFGFTLQTGTRTLILRISMVGPYYLLLRVKYDGACSLIESATSVSLAEQNLIELLSQAGLQMLDERTLLFPVALALSNTEPDNIRMFQRFVHRY